AALSNSGSCSPLSLGRPWTPMTSSRPPGGPHDAGVTDGLRSRSIQTSDGSQTALAGASLREPGVRRRMGWLAGARTRAHAITRGASGTTPSDRARGVSMAVYAHEATDVELQAPADGSFGGILTRFRTAFPQCRIADG